MIGSVHGSVPPYVDRTEVWLPDQWSLDGPLQTSRVASLVVEIMQQLPSVDASSVGGPKQPF